ncbi:MAG: 30S ribosome-binding factor RbfA [Rhodobacteraceae bacterium]|nr:30S ribosome-binding factor RbfA [Paracoccaceae bacterium]
MCAKRFQSGSGPSQRQLRVAEVIRHRLAEVLSRGEVHDPDLSRMSITVSEVRTSADLQHATVFVMPLGGRDADIALKALRRNKGELRHLVAAGMRLRFAPDLKFELDKTFDAMDNARRMFADPRVKADVEAPDDPEAAGDTDPDSDLDRDLDRGDAV